MKKLVFIGLVVLPTALLISSFTSSVKTAKRIKKQTSFAIPMLPPSSKIKIALLLDTSNSMDGLIEQAKSQLWKLVNELAKFKYQNEKPELEIALYEYGNDRLDSKEGYIRQVSAFSNDLDVISEKLFSLTTNGGNEYCGHVIQTSLQQLDWLATGDLKIIFIAGNEPFNQGNVSFETSCEKAKEKSVFINTIFCGSYDEGSRTQWKQGATLANGSYMNIDQNQKTVYIETPFDSAIEALNDKLNATYVYYGVSGFSKKEKQLEQDKNASFYGKSNSTERIVTKSSGFYKNTSWDLVDASKEKSFDITKIKEEELPKELKGKTKEFKIAFVESKKKEREAIKAEINELNKKRTAFIVEKQKQLSTTANSLDAVMIAAIKEQAAKKGFDLATN